MMGTTRQHRERAASIAARWSAWSVIGRSSSAHDEDEMSAHWVGPLRVGRMMASYGVMCGAAAVLLAMDLSTAWVAPLFDPDEGYYPATAAESVDARIRFSGLPRSVDVMWICTLALWPAAALLAVTAIMVTVAHQQAAVRTLIITGAVMPALIVAGADRLPAEAYPWERVGSAIRDTAMPVYLVGPRAPSLTFSANHRVIRLGESDATAWRLPAQEAWIVSDSEWLSRRLLNEGDRRWQTQGASGGMMLARWHGADPPSGPH